MADQIAATGRKPGPVRVTLARAGTTAETAPVVMVRRIKDSDRNLAAQAAQFVVGQTWSERRMSEFLLRMAVVGAERLTDADDGYLVDFETVTHGLLGKIASSDVYNALGTEDCVAIAAAMNGKPQLTEEAKGN